MAPLLAEAVQRLGSAGVDVVVVTGDLVDHPLDVPDSADSLRQGRADLELVGAALGKLDCPWMVLPGNHDHDQLFAEVFGHASLDVDVAGTRLLSFHDWDRYLTPAEATPVAPVPDNVPDNVPRRLGDARRRLLAALADGDPRPQVHLQHYVITPRRDDGWPHTYQDGEQLRDMLGADPRVRLVLSGHYHPGVESFRPAGDNTGPWFCVAPAFCQVPHPYLIHELAPTGGLTTSRFDLPGVAS